jgi:hypothetical protein
VSDLRTALLEILSQRDTPVGIGLAVTKPYVLTCAHVVCQAVAIDKSTSDKPSREISLRFLENGERVIATVVAWSPFGLPSKGNHDVAVLRIISGKFPEGFHSPTLFECPMISGAQFRVYGMPEHYTSGRWGYGTIQALLPGSGQLQVHSKDITFGYSGGPVQETQLGRLIGIVSTSDSPQHTAFVIPARVINAVCVEAKVPVVVKHIDAEFGVLTDGLLGLPDDPLTKIEKFLLEYLGDVGEPTPFGGRARQLQELDNWLKDTTRPFALVVAPAGRGKSALVTRWASSVAISGTAKVAFVPISNRFDLSLMSTVLSVWGARLRHIVEMPPTEAHYGSVPSSDWLADISQLLRMPRASDDPPLLSILDGLDEVSEGSLRSSWALPRTLPEGVKILVSARQLAGDASEQGWVKRLGWHRSATVVRLPNLTRIGLAEVLEQMGEPLSELRIDDEFVERLHYLSQGDPLLVRLYVEALKEKGESAPLSPKDLEQAVPGLHAFFETWWEAQRRQWERDRKDHRALNDQAQALLYTLACGLGPLWPNDIAQVAPRSSGLDDREIQRQALRTLDRFIIGDGQSSGYVFSHPRLLGYFRERMELRHDLPEWKERFHDYGRRTLDALAEKTLKPGEVSTYIVRFYAEHLVDSSAQPESLYRLASADWLSASSTRDPTLNSFLADVEKIRGVASSVQNIPMQILCALCGSSIRTINSGIPPNVIQQAVSHGVVDPPKSVELANQLRNESDRLGAITRVFRFVDETLQGEALRILETGCSLLEVAQNLVEVLPYLSADTKRSTARKAWDRALMASRVMPKAELLVELAEYIQPLTDPTSADLLTCIRQVPFGSQRGSLLRRALPYLAGADLTCVFAEALSLIRSIGCLSFGGRMHWLWGLIPFSLENAYHRGVVDPVSQEDLLQELALLTPILIPYFIYRAFLLAREIDDPISRAAVFGLLSPVLPPDLREAPPEALRKAVEDQVFVPPKDPEDIDLHPPAPLFAALAILQLPFPASTCITSGPYDWADYKLPIELPHSLPAKWRHAMLQTQLKALGNSRLETGIETVATTLIKSMTDQEVEQILPPMRFWFPERRAWFLPHVLPRLSAPQCAKELQQFLKDDWDTLPAQTQEQVLPRLSSSLPSSLAGDLIEKIRSTNQSRLLAVALAEMIPSLTAHDQKPAAAEALRIARTIGDDAQRQGALHKLAVLFPDQSESILNAVVARPRRARASSGDEDDLAIGMLIEAGPVNRDWLTALLAGLSDLGQTRLFNKIRLQPWGDEMVSRLVVWHSGAPPELRSRIEDLAREVIESVDPKDAVSRLRDLYKVRDVLPDARNLQRSIWSRDITKNFPKLKPERLPKNLRTDKDIRKMAKVSNWMTFISTIAHWVIPSLRDDLLAPSVDYALEMRNPFYRLDFAFRLSPHLSAGLQDRVLNGINTLYDLYPWLDVVAAMPHVLPENVFQKTWSKVKDIKGELTRSQYAARVFAKMPATLVKTRLELITDIVGWEAKVSALLELGIAHESERSNIYRDVLEIIPAGRVRESDRALVLQLIAGCPHDLYSTVLRIIKKVPVLDMRREALSLMAARAEETERVAILSELIKGINTDSTSRSSQIRLLGQISPFAAHPQCASMVKTAMHTIGGNIVHSLSESPRDVLLMEIMQILPLVRVLLDDQAIVEIANGIREVGTWWQ